MRSDRPNIILILADDLGWADLGCYGSTFHESPRLDRLAAEGVRFTDAYSAAPVCSATRASIMTGKYPATVDLTDFIPGHQRPWAKLAKVEFSQQLPLEEISIARALKRAGYVSANIGKWHLGGEGCQPGDHGFDHVFHSGENDDDKQVRALTENTLEFIEANQDRPFLCILSHYTVHIPLEAKERLTAKYAAKADPNAKQNNPTYAAMIEVMDDSVGRVLDKLDELGIADNTVVMFMSDNGGLVQWYIGDGPVVTSNEPLRGEKGTLYEGGLRVPLIVRWPGRTRKGAVSDAPVTTADLFPTWCEMAGVEFEVTLNHEIDGESMVPLLTGHGWLSRESIYFHYPHYHHAPPMGVIRRGDLKLIERFEDGGTELYDLRADIGEGRDLSEERPDTVRDLLAELRAWRESIGAKVPEPNPDYDPDRADEWSTYPQSWWL